MLCDVCGRGVGIVLLSGVVVVLFVLFMSFVLVDCSVVTVSMSAPMSSDLSVNVA